MPVVDGWSTTNRHLINEKIMARSQLWQLRKQLIRLGAGAITMVS